MCRLLTLVVATSTMLFATGQSSAADSKLPPIKVVKEVKPARAVFKMSSRKKPIIIRNEKLAAKYFSEGELKKLKRQIDFKRQFAVVFAWRGSGQDRLTYSVLESFPEQIAFKYKPGRTRDLRPHVHIFALRSNVKWRAK